MSTRAEELQALLQYMTPGSTVCDIVGESESDEEEITGVKFIPGTNTQREITSLSKMQPSQHTTTNANVLRRIRVDDFYSDTSSFANGASRVNQRVMNELREVTMSNRLTSTQSSHEVDRSERATVENVMDPRTRLILYKLVNSGQLREINGCVSTGKEANVYYAVAGDGSDVALKVFKTSILVFKDRDKYVAGEFRFQRYCKSNPRKMVRTWAEKEARNLNRLQDGGVLAPAVKLLRQHVLVMEFLGEDGWPAPRLKDVRFPSASALDKCYLDLCCTMRKMYGRCRLIHGDLSEYNLLLYRGRVVVIDVSQSVESDHPHAMDFLRRDIVNINTFFRSKGHQQLFSLQDLYHFITASPASRGWQRCEGPDNCEEILQYLLQLRETRAAEGKDVQKDSEQAKIDEQVFLNIAVPRSLGEIADHKAPNSELAPYVAAMTSASLTKKEEEEEEEEEESEEENEKKTKGKKNKLKKSQRQQEKKNMESSDDNEDDDEEEYNEDDDDDEEESSSYDDEAHEKKDKKKNNGQKILAEMTKEERKEYHRAVKEANRERRANKKKGKNGRSKLGAEVLVKTRQEMRVIERSDSRFLRFFTRRRPIDYLALEVDGPITRELHSSFRIVKHMCTFLLMSPVLFLLITGTLAPSYYLLVPTGLVTVEQFHGMWEFAHWAVVLAGQLFIFIILYDLSVYVRYPFFAYGLAPVYRRLGLLKGKRPGSKFFNLGSNNKYSNLENNNKYSNLGNRHGTGLSRPGNRRPLGRPLTSEVKGRKPQQPLGAQQRRK